MKTLRSSFHFEPLNGKAFQHHCSWEMSSSGPGVCKATSRPFVCTAWRVLLFSPAAKPAHSIHVNFFLASFSSDFVVLPLAFGITPKKLICCLHQLRNLCVESWLSLLLEARTAVVSSGALFL